LSVKELERYQQ